MGFVPGAARVRQAAHGAARLERGRGTRRAESRGTGKKKGREGEGAPTGGARLPERGGAGLCGLGRRLRERLRVERRRQVGQGRRWERARARGVREPAWEGGSAGCWATRAERREEGARVGRAGC